jgi:hypothetical protein
LTDDKKERVIRLSKKIAAAGLALLLALSVSACTAKGPAAPAAPAPAAGNDQKTPGAYAVNPITADDAPQALKDWAAAEQMNTQPAYKVYDQNGATYVAVTAGQKSSGGWTGAAAHIGVTVRDAGDLLELDVVWTPPSGMATMALTNPVVYFKAAPAVVGEVRVQSSMAPISLQMPDAPEVRHGGERQVTETGHP